MGPLVVDSLLCQEAEESRLWYQAMFEQHKVSAAEHLGHAMKRYRLNSQMLATVMGGSSLAEVSKGRCTILYCLLVNVPRILDRFVMQV